MASRPVDEVESGSAGALVAMCVAEAGSAAHRWFAPDRSHGSRDIADAIHFLCVLHGRHPGVIELAALRATEPAARAWLTDAADAMADERRYLAKLAVAAGGARAPRLGAERGGRRRPARRIGHPRPVRPARLRGRRRFGLRTRLAYGPRDARRRREPARRRRPALRSASPMRPAWSPT